MVGNLSIEFSADDARESVVRCEGSIRNGREEIWLLCGEGLVN